MKSIMFRLYVGKKKYCHAEFDSKFNIFCKKSAMFGLDARIALAIFGALSVITGAALYSAIKNTKNIAMVTQLEEVLKSVESYMLDTGVDLPTYTAQPQRVKSCELNSSVITGWNGPYIGSECGEILNNSWQEVLPYAITLTKNSDLDWTDSAAQDCSAGGNCYYWATFSIKRIDKEYMKAIDLLVDGTDSPNSGKFRVRSWATPLTSGSLKGPRVLAP